MTATRIDPEAQEALATVRFIRMSSTKARQVVDLIRGRRIDDARRVLAFTPRSACTHVRKVLDSAVANAEHNRGLPADELIVSRAWVDEGPTLRRYRPRALGRATRINKRTCHISVVVGRIDEEASEPAERKGTRRRRRGAGEGPAGEKTTRKKTTRKKATGKSSAKETTRKKTTRRREEES
ncbi:MAG: 50S ribosomal protein L22 [Actinomycetota bacterium]